LSFVYLAPVEMTACGALVCEVACYLLSGKHDRCKMFYPEKIIALLRGYICVHRRHKTFAKTFFCKLVCFISHKITRILTASVILRLHDESNVKQLEHTSCTCILNMFASCFFYRVNGV